MLWLIYQSLFRRHLRLNSLGSCIISFPVGRWLVCVKVGIMASAGNFAVHLLSPIKQVAFLKKKFSALLGTGTVLLKTNTQPERLNQI